VEIKETVAGNADSSVNTDAGYGCYLYGARIRSPWRFPFVTPVAPSYRDVDVLDGAHGQFQPMFREGGLLAQPAMHAPWLLVAQLADDVVFFRWAGEFEFLISKDGRTVVSRRLHPGPDNAFFACLLGPALSYALIRQGLEPLHATACVRGDVAIAFMGESGRGKSTLAAAFLRAGFDLLTDDQLVLMRSGDRYIAHPGPPQLKLFPEIARDVLGMNASATPMAATSGKHVFPIPVNHQGQPTLERIYLLGRVTGPQRVTIRRLSMRRACIALIEHSFNVRLTDSERLHRQFLLATSVAGHVPIKLLSYPRELSRLAEVRDAVFADVEQSACG
jgi:hypothetical protein